MAVSLYRIQLDPGHFWRLGLEVTAQRDGGSLDTALALFDDQGRLIASDDVGRADAPKDPYLFAGLPTGNLLRWRLRGGKPARLAGWIRSRDRIARLGAADSERRSASRSTWSPIPWTRRRRSWVLRSTTPIPLTPHRLV